MLVIHPARNILKSLLQESRDKLAQCLNEANFDDLAGLKGIGPGKMAFLLGGGALRYEWRGLSLKAMKPQVKARGIPWPKFVSTARTVDYSRGADDASYCISTQVFSTTATIKALLGHFEIPLDYDVNEHLVELRDLRARLSFLLEMKDPVIQDYLRLIGQELLIAPGARR